MILIVKAAIFQSWPSSNKISLHDFIIPL